ncbi:hypothetical protein SAMD00019534_006690 [Acytostelium subglobosum LB1]|uniref:hypothetical protein n=1 Tax=Acytostelium subglobosum LB1 TaxID=1410327 RepID=UPI00064515A1|nr:hypothetical protein SAMD00019534_006690 [Acytostelium subglobosum LB1]GAM17494.1 hypothetical protein SAMD00019534_006690 [Acytostelium subglobosum LB1]|eukprot:XP_012759556.1 hypothetical protein SAMD00019534_006690 [Acytostelium subglobosum LB1]
MWFGHNKLRPLALYDTDYMGHEPRPIRTKLIERYKDHQSKSTDIADVDLIDRVELATMPRYLNMQFNPVNFYYCYARDGILLQVVVEINNTFGETHLYFPQVTSRPQGVVGANGDGGEKDSHFERGVNRERYLQFAVQDKDFHVSPFNSLDGSYTFCFSDPRACFDIRIILLSKLDSTCLDGKNSPNSLTCSETNMILSTRLWSPHASLSLSNANLFRLVTGYPVTTLLTLPRIMYEAGRLHYRKRLQVYAKPNPPTNNTPIIIECSPAQRFSQRWLFEYLATFPKGVFVFHNLDGTSTTIDCSGNLEMAKVPVPENLYSDSTKPITLHIKSFEFYSKLYLFHTRHPGLSAKALGMAFMADEFTCDDLPSFLALVCDLTVSSRAHKSNPVSSQQQTDDQWGWIHHMINPNVMSKYFLDQGSMMTHCGHLETITKEKQEGASEDRDIFNCKLEDDNIDTLYINSLNQLVVDKLNLYKDDHLLELEPGWGSFTLYAAKNIGCKITAITRHDHHHRHLLAMIQKEGPHLEELVTVVLVSNNDVEYKTPASVVYDKILSLEGEFHQSMTSQMLLEMCKQRVRPGGLIFLQAITGPYHPYQQGDIKPTKPLSWHQLYALMRVHLESRIWGALATFAHNPFLLEARYQALLGTLGQRGFVNGHSSTKAPSSPDHSDIPNLSKDAVDLLTSRYAYELQLLEMENVGDHYPPLFDYWQRRLASNKSKLITDMQQEAMSKGCLLKMNEADLGEIPRAIQFHHHYLTACFKSVWSVTRLLVSKFE